MKTGDQALTVGEVARRSGVAVSTIHFYERQGLIEPWRTAGNQRRYPRRILRRIAIIRVAQRAGMPLATIAKHLADLPTENVTKEQWHTLSTGWRQELEGRIASLTQLRDELESCIGCGCLSLVDCPLRNPDDALATKGTGPLLLGKEKAPYGKD